MNKEISPAALWRSHQKNLNPCQKDGAFEEIFHRQQQNNGHNQKEEENQEIPLANVEIGLKEVKE